MKNTYKNLDENELPEIDEMCYFVRYNAVNIDIGYLIDERTVYIPFTAAKESILNFKAFRPLNINEKPKPFFNPVNNYQQFY